MIFQVNLLVAATVVCGPRMAIGQQSDAPEFEDGKPLVTISAETTRVTAPLTKDGYPHFQNAINARYSEGVTPENNSIVEFYRAIGPAPGGQPLPASYWKLLGTEPPVRTLFIPLRDLFPADADSEKLYEDQGRAMDRPWSSTELPKITRWIDANAEALELVTRGAKRDRYYSPFIGYDLGTADGDDAGLPEGTGLIGELMPNLSELRDFARLLLCRSMRAIGQGEWEAAWQDLVTMQRMARLLSQGPTVIESLVGYSIEGLAAPGVVKLLQSRQWTAAELEQIVRDVNQLPAFAAIADRIDFSERLILIDSVLLMARDRQAAREVLAIENLDGVFGIVRLFGARSYDWDATLKTANGWYDRAVKVMRIQDPVVRHQELKKFDTELEQLRNSFKDRLANPEQLKVDRRQLGSMLGEVVVALLVSAIPAVEDAENRTLQYVDTVRTAVAVAHYQAVHGTFPASLAELRLMPAPRDRYSSQPLIYRVEGGRVSCYSIGRNRRDDGGWRGQIDFEHDDLGFQLTAKPDHP